MEITSNIYWTYYTRDNYKYRSDACGKWMYFFDNKDFVAEICKNAVKNNIVAQSKHSNSKEGVACFYLNIDDNKSHKKVLSYFIENNLIPRNRNGKLKNIAFKLDNQTRRGEYGEKFKAKLKLSDFIDLNTEEWI